MKLQRFPEVCQKIRGAVVAGIQVKFVWDAFCLKLLMEFGRSFFKFEFILTAAIEIDRQPWSAYQSTVPFRKDKGTVLVPVLEVNGIAEDRSEQPAQRCPPGDRLSLSRRFCDERGTLCTDRRE